MSPDVRERLASLPQVDALLRRSDAVAAIDEHGRRAVTDALRGELESARERIREGAPPPAPPELVRAAVARLDGRRARRLQRVINATGVVLHTNLGRAPLSATAREAVLEAAGYASLEYDLTTGERGSRTAHLGELAAQLCGTPAATVVNNGAAALVLVLQALAADREVVVSRGELIEIGGSFRLPDIMQAAGCRLVEVGTTNRTRIGDYRDAVGEDTALLLKVHRSNYAMVGFTEETPIDQLVELGRSVELPVVHDLGSGLVHAPATGPLAGQPSVTQSVRAGVDLVLFSGDKLLGGPQAGVIAGHGDLVERCSRHPLARALRVDKLQRAALEATLASHLRREDPVDLPTYAMLAADPAALAERAGWMAEQLGPGAEAVELQGVVGGGTSPEVGLASWGVAVGTVDAEELARSLRAGDPPVVARIEDDRVVLDLRTVPPTQDGELVDLVLAARG